MLSIEITDVEIISLYITIYLIELVKFKYSSIANR